MVSKEKIKILNEFVDSIIDGINKLAKTYNDNGLKDLMTYALIIKENINFIDKDIIHSPDNNKKINHKKILIIDDNKSTVKVVKDYLKRSNISCKIAMTGKEGMKVLQESKPDVVLLDINLPDINGYEMCRRIKNTTDIPVVLFTANPPSQVQEKIKEIKADDCIYKPFSLNDLNILLNYF